MRSFGGPMARLAREGSRNMLLRQDARALSSRAEHRSCPSGRKTVRTATFGHARGPSIASKLRQFSSQNPSKDTQSSSSSTSDAEVARETKPPPDALSSSTTELPSVTDSRRSDFNQRFSHVMDNVQARVLTASQTLNDITGYSAIEAIKKENDALEVQLAEAHSKVYIARQAYKTSNTKRAMTQREVTTLLARKDTWSPADLERFTELYRTDHVLEGEVSGAQEALTESELEEQSLSQRLNAGILKRYHEEQIWSDRIRRASTWGTWGLMGMNFILFIVFQFVAEPWRRKKLVKGVVEEEKRVLEEVRGELEAVKSALAKNGEVLPPTTQEVPAATITSPELPSGVWADGGWTEVIMDPARWKAIAADLCSERVIDVRMKDASALALQGALTGAAVAGSIAMLLMRKT
ncbi:sensitivity to high expression protein she9 [Conoideocrella luteorostrata]|uniref:Sensitive to high expression protein 9, mitochondrial n=1 Tax=Conoideocrella luteorostrata TaxID=1105319 RepID=A0AAJ0CXA6_9HYPO|nr:sensitivity to high expression protein she9 [Conoideocrella luteorostrata]